MEAGPIYRSWQPGKKTDPARRCGLQREPASECHRRSNRPAPSSRGFWSFCTLGKSMSFLLRSTAKRTARGSFCETMKGTWIRLQAPRKWEMARNDPSIYFRRYFETPGSRCLKPRSQSLQTLQAPCNLIVSQNYTTNITLYIRSRY